MSRIKLSFDEKNIKTSIVKTENTNEDGDLVVRTETIVELPCYFRNTRLNGQLKNFGFENLPNGMENILNRYGFVLNKETGNWNGVVVGKAFHIATVKKDGTIIQSDEYSEKFGLVVATTRAKVKSQFISYRIMCEFKGLFDTISEIFTESLENFNENFLIESDALLRAEETGYCDINKQF